MDIQYLSVLNTNFETEGLIRPCEMGCLNCICTYRRESILKRHIVSDTLLLLLNLKLSQTSMLVNISAQYYKLLNKIASEH